MCIIGRIGALELGPILTKQALGETEELCRWFKRRLKQEKVWIGRAQLSYDGNTSYDLKCYRLQAEAARHWRLTYGFEPTPGQLSRAFFMAEFERFRDRHPPLWRSLRKLKCWLRFFLLSFRGT